MPRAFSISATDIAAESKRTGGDHDKFDFANVLKLDTVELRPMGPGDVHLKILAVSAEHNVDHAILADTINIAEARGGKIYPGNSALGEVLAVGSDVKNVKPGDIVVTHCNGDPDVYGFPLRIWAYDQPESVGWYGEEAVVGDWQLVAAPYAARGGGRAGSRCGQSRRGSRRAHAVLPVDLVYEPAAPDAMARDRVIASLGERPC